MAKNYNVSIAKNVLLDNDRSDGEWLNENEFAVIKENGAVVVWGGLVLVSKP